MNFNSSQIEAVSHLNGPALVLAGPGSGKTAVVTHRVQTLITTHKVNPSNILVITFTKAAAREMKERFLKLMGCEHTTVYFGTFHGLFFSILRHAYHYQPSDIVTEEERFSIMQRLVSQYQVACEDEKEMAGNLLGEISRIKGGLMDVAHYYPVNCGQEIFQKLYAGYEKALHSGRKIDFDDMLVFCHELFLERKDILAAWQHRFQYILIDEFQDINAAQYNVVRLLAAPAENLFVVGDDDQSIYGFRGASPEIMLNFEKDYPDSRRIVLNVNYRSQSNIVGGALSVIANNKKRFPKDIKAFRPAADGIEVCCYQEIADENRAVIDRIRKSHHEGIKYSEMAVLTRVNSGARLIAERLHEYNIPFFVKDAMPNIYDHWIAQNIFSYIRIALGSRERRLFLNIINRPRRYVSRDVFDSQQVSFEEILKNYYDKPWMAERIERLEEDIAMLGRLNPFGAVNYIRRVIGYNDFLEEYAREKGIKAEELFDILNELQELSREYDTYNDWFVHMEKYRDELKRQHMAEQEQTEGVQIMTMHGAKGLEFSQVFIIDANEGVTPYKKAVLDSEIEEERRMFYVAMTRAKDKLIICHVKNRYNKEAALSRFVTEFAQKSAT